MPEDSPLSQLCTTMPYRHRSSSLPPSRVISAGKPASWRWVRATLSAWLVLTCLPAHALAIVEVQAQSCSPLLMQAECDQYLQRLRQASSEALRREIATEYETIVNERQRSCPLLMVAPAKPAVLRAARPND